VNVQFSLRLPRFFPTEKSWSSTSLQNQDGVAPSAQSGGEASLNSMAANIANAVDRAVGVRIRQARSLRKELEPLKKESSSMFKVQSQGTESGTH